MTIDEKLSHFYDVTIEDAQAKAAGILEEHRKALAQMTEKHKADSQENAQVQIKAETANARREINKALSAEQLTIKRDWTKKQNELKEKLFAEVKTQLENFRNTPDYPAYLESKIKDEIKRKLTLDFLNTFADIVQTALFIVMTIWMAEYTIDLDVKNQITTANQWPMWLMSLPVTVSCGLMAFHALLNALEDIIDLAGKKDRKAVA